MDQKSRRRIGVVVGTLSITAVVGIATQLAGLHNQIVNFELRDGGSTATVWDQGMLSQDASRSSHQDEQRSAQDEQHSISLQKYSDDVFSYYTNDSFFTHVHDVLSAPSHIEQGQDSWQEFQTRAQTYINTYHALPEWMGPIDLQGTLLGMIYMTDEWVELCVVQRISTEKSTSRIMTWRMDQAYAEKLKSLVEDKTIREASGPSQEGE